MKNLHLISCLIMTNVGSFPTKNGYKTRMTPLLTPFNNKLEVLASATRLAKEIKDIQIQKEKTKQSKTA